MRCLPQVPSQCNKLREAAMKKKKANATRSKAKPAKKAKAKKSKPVKKAKTALKSKKSKTQASASKRAKSAVASVPKSGVIAPANSVLLGFVEDYYAKVGVIALTLKAPVAVGQKIQVLGHTTHLDQIVSSMQIDHLAVERAAKGDGIGIKVNDRARGGDHVYLLK